MNSQEGKLRHHMKILSKEGNHATLQEDKNMISASLAIQSYTKLVPSQPQLVVRYWYMMLE